MSDPRKRFTYRNRFMKAISSGPKKRIIDSGIAQCHFCGKTENVEITDFVKEKCPPTEIDPSNSLSWQMLFDGWVTGLTQVYTGTGVIDWDLTLCPKCADEHLELAEQALKRK